MVLGAGALMTDWTGAELTIQNHEASKGRVLAAANSERRGRVAAPPGATGSDASSAGGVTGAAEAMREARGAISYALMHAPAPPLTTHLLGDVLICRVHVAVAYARDCHHGPVDGRDEPGDAETQEYVY